MALQSSERLVYVRPDGVQYLLHAPPSRAVLSEEGFGMPALKYNTDRYPFQSGDSVRSVVLEPRALQITVTQNYCSRADYWSGRASLLDAIRPNRIGNFNNPGKLLYYRSGGSKRQLDVIPDSGPGFAPPQGGWRAWSFTEVLRFVAHDPVWYDPVQHTLDINVAGALPVSSDMFYNGTWAEQPSLYLVGPITNPVITNTWTDTKLALNYTFAAGETANFSLHGQRYIIKNDGTNLVPFLTPDSDFTTFTLEPEDNTIELNGSGAVAGTTALHMYWYDRYIGI